MNRYLQAAAIGLVAVLLLGSGSGDAPGAAAQGDPLVVFAAIDDEAIGPMTVQYVRRVLKQAVEQNAQCLVLRLDTPGGLVQSTRVLVKDILDSPIPIVIYVAPAGARATSAGVFIAYAAHVTAMAPGTQIGAAHPVPIGGGPGGPSPGGPRPIPPGNEPRDGRDGVPGEEDPAHRRRAPSTPMEDKQLQDTIAWIRSLAELRGRNAEWAVEAVSESASITSGEALEKGVIDILAGSREELLRELHGRTVAVADGRQVNLDTWPARTEHVAMWWGERLLLILSNPNLAFLLLIFGFYGILFELYSPGWGVSGTLGVLCLLLGFFGLSVLPINVAALGLVILALALFVAEAFITSFGALTLGGIVCLVLGGLMLVDSPTGFMRVSAAVVVPVALATAAITVFLVASIVRGYRHHVRIGDQALTGRQAVAAQDFQAEDNCFRGMVSVSGELWNAASTQKICKGDTVNVAGRDGLTLRVAPRLDHT